MLFEWFFEKEKNCERINEWKIGNVSVYSENIDEDKDVLLEFRRWNLDKYSMQFFLILSHVREN